MSRYVIENCPCYNKDYSCQSKANITGKYCKDCTDCVLKQIVELCKRTCEMRCTNYCLGAKKYYGYGQILKLLDIQEVE